MANFESNQSLKTTSGKVPLGSGSILGNQLLRPRAAIPDNARNTSADELVPFEIGFNHVGLCVRELLIIGTSVLLLSLRAKTPQIMRVRVQGGTS